LQRALQVLQIRLQELARHFADVQIGLQGFADRIAGSTVNLVIVYKT